MQTILKKELDLFTDRIARSEENDLRKEILAAFILVASSVSVTTLSALIDRKDIEGITTALKMDRMTASRLDVLRIFDDVIQRLKTVFVSSGTATISNMSTNITSRTNFEVFAPFATRVVDRSNFEMVVGLQDEAREMLRSTLTRAFETGGSTTQIAQSLKNRIGLTTNQSGFADNFRQQLTERNNFSFTSVGRRRLSATDRALAIRHLAEGNLSRSSLDALVNRYTKSLGELRALAIAQTESVRAAVEGQLQAWNQVVEEGFVAQDRVRKFSIVTKDDRARDTHVAIATDTFRGISSLNPNGVRLDEPFRTPFGPRQGPPYETNCRCGLLIEEVA